MTVRCSLVAVALTAVAALLPASAAAQAVAGVVTDAAGEVLPGATVALVAPADPLAAPVVVGATADEDGRYLLRAPGPGRFVVRATFVGYAPAVSGPLDLAASDRVVVDVELAEAEAALGDVEVAAAREVDPLEAAGFHTRRAQGWGRFVDRQEIEDRRPRVLSDLFNRLPGFVVLRSEGDVRVNSVNYPVTRGTACRPTIVVDGTVLRSFGDAVGGASKSGLPTDPLFNLDQALRIDDVEAVEAYAHNGIPAQYGGTMSPCGAVLIWTRSYARAQAARAAAAEDGE